MLSLQKKRSTWKHLNEFYMNLFSLNKLWWNIINLTLINFNNYLQKINIILFWFYLKTYLRNINQFNILNYKIQSIAYEDVGTST
jgi:hypothetical protein